MAAFHSCLAQFQLGHKLREEADDNSVLHVGSSPVEETQFTTTKVPYREGVFSQGGVHRCIPEVLEGSVLGRNSKNGLL